MVPGRSFIQTLLLLGISTGVWARRGGGDEDSDSGGDSSSSTGGDTSSSSTDHCGSSHQSLSAYDVIPDNVANWTSMTAPWQDRATTYDGSYFYGEAFLNYSIEGESHCSDTDSPIRMLAYAWLGPQSPYPKGSKNAFALGFKAWLSDLPLDQIANSYDKVPWGEYCPIAPDLVKIQTSRKYTDFEKRTVTASDVIDMEFSEDQDHANMARFNGTLVNGVDISENWYNDIVALPPSVCDTDGVQGLGWPAGTTLSGSVTNSTIKLRLEGVSNTTTDYKHYVGTNEDEIRVMFSVTFSGTFDGINSTQALKVADDGQALFSWVENGGLHVVPFGWTTWLLWMAFMGVLSRFMF
ncbi:hypothetical protein FE257_004544 [Aspergillus nanangensis]|uniref:Uncharacterized protein n=1 Tax=Aspergillus nanangensis TaxID=2582783 RepID=A0AAD4CYL5_ASPNN|nr:hypothetical protein FE257_004544 [Aspergillus nanangensis]